MGIKKLDKMMYETRQTRQQKFVIKAPQKTLESPVVRQIRTPLKIGRNSPCPCGSGKKYKKCCMR